MRKLTTIIAAMGFVFTACSGTAADPTSPTTTAPTVVSTSPTTPPSTMVVDPDPTTTSLTIWAPESLVGPLGDTAAGFEIETGIGVEVIPMAAADMLEALLADPAAGPDIFVGPHAWLSILTGAGIAEPLVVDPSVVAGAAAGVELRGASYAAPIGLDTLAQFRNDGSLSASPTTVESFASGCSVGGATVPCLTLSTTSVVGHWPFITALGGYVFGPDEFDGWDKDDVGVDAAEAIAGGLVLEQAAQGTGILGDGSTTALERFIAGEAPLFWGTTSDLAALELTGMSFTVERLPTIGDQAAAGPVETTALWVNAFSADKETAVELVEDHLALPAAARILAVGLGLAPVDAEFNEDPDLVPFTQGARTGLPMPTIDAIELAMTELADAFEDIRSGQAADLALSGAASNIRAGA